jgi:hypothetical protein
MERTMIEEYEDEEVEGEWTPWIGIKNLLAHMGWGFLRTC